MYGLFCNGLFLIFIFQLIETILCIILFFFKNKEGKFYYLEYDKSLPDGLNRNEYFRLCLADEDLQLLLIFYILISFIIVLLKSYIPLVNVFSFVFFLFKGDSKIDSELNIFLASVINNIFRNINSNNWQ
jgi:hypothetical protein